MDACNEWYRIGVDYKEGVVPVEQVRQRATAQLSSITEWESDGVTHLLGRLEHGLRSIFPVKGTGLSFGILIAARETCIPALDFRSEVFIAEFKGLLGLEDSEANNFDRFLLEQRLSGEQYPPYHRIQRILPMVTKWVQLQYGSENHQTTP